MLRALRVVSVERGHDPRDFALVAFGGAGPLHACALAEELGDRAPCSSRRAAGVLSALGLVAERRAPRHGALATSLPLAEMPASFRPRARRTSATRGQSFELTGAARAATSPSASTTRTRSGTATRTATAAIELVAVRTAEIAARAAARRSTRRAGLGAEGPQVVELDGATCLGPGGLGRARRTGTGTLRARDGRLVIDIELQVIGSVAARGRGGDGRGARSARPSRRTSRSGATARPRCSTRRGRMVAQAEHIPVHLGAMPEAVAAVMALRPGAGRRRGSSTTRTPAARTCRTSRSSPRTELGFAVDARPPRRRRRRSSPAACRPGRATLDEEGVVIPPTRLDERRCAACSSRNMRNPDERRGDLRAQLGGAAARRAARRRALRAPRPRPSRCGDGRALRVLRARVRAAIRRAARTAATRRADVLETADGRARASGSAVTVAGDAIEIDFDGTAPQHEGNLNCPLAVTRSACFFVVRCLTDSRPPRLGRRLRPGDRAARPRAASSTPGRRPRSPPGTRRRRAASPTSSSTRSARRSPCPHRARGR